jgi:ABC-type microcin C transport system permease subunit YejB
MHDLSYNRSMQLIKWTGTILCLIGIALTSFNVYPLNILFGLIGSGLWTYAGVLQRDIPLILVEAVAVALYFAGLAAYVS